MYKWIIKNKIPLLMPLVKMLKIHIFLML